MSEDYPTEAPEPAPLTVDKRLHRLSGHAREKRGFNTKHSRFIKRMRVAMPLAALCIIAVLFSWNVLNKETLVPKLKESKNSQSITKNELLSPRFDSVDAKNQPYSITAKKATQNENDDKLILLEAPLADMTLKSGRWLAIEAEQGAYDQTSQHLLLKGNVNLYHDEGYLMQTAELDVDMDKELAWSNTTVKGQGPMGLLDATGLKADSKAGTLFFKGPAKLVLFKTQSKKASPTTPETATP
jgi:lipopolysaccharide export system protein LptC